MPRTQVVVHHNLGSAVEHSGHRRPKPASSHWGALSFHQSPQFGVVVALEGLALPLIHSAAITAISFTLLNAALMVVRIRCENEASPL